MIEDIETIDFVTTINVLRRIAANPGGNSDRGKSVFDPWRTSVEHQLRP